MRQVADIARGVHYSPPVSRRLTLAIALAACSAPAAPPARPTLPTTNVDPDGPHRAAVAAQVQPFLESELISGLVVGLYDGGKLEIYGFGAGPGGKPPTGSTLFEIGSVTKVFTGILLADAVQRREVSLDGPVSELMPPGITVPTGNKVAITLRHLMVHSSGLPRVPPSLTAPRPDPYAGYGEEHLYRDLLATELESPPGTRISYSNYGVGLLGFALGRKIGGGYAAALQERVLKPLGMRDTYFGFPPGAPRAEGTDEDLQPALPWTFDALAGAGALVSTARDQLRLIDAELDALAGSKLPLRAPLRLTQESQLEEVGANAGLGWVIDREGRYWHNGGTGGFHSFVGFDPKSRRGVVILAATSTSLVDRLSSILYKVLAKEPSPPVVFPTADKLAPLAGNYDFSGTTLTISVSGKRIYIEGPGEPRHRLQPLTETEFLLEPLNAVVVFQKEGDKVARIVFAVGGTSMIAPRIP
jgi:D-alanyl-D-alanine-carboxypeptidase/D-alanyl-D-alanine-endopeptidase